MFKVIAASLQLCGMPRSQGTWWFIMPARVLICPAQLALSKDLPGSWSRGSDSSHDFRMIPPCMGRCLTEQRVMRNWAGLLMRSCRPLATSPRPGRSICWRATGYPQQGTLFIFHAFFFTHSLGRLQFLQKQKQKTTNRRTVVLSSRKPNSKPFASTQSKIGHEHTTTPNSIAKHPTLVGYDIQIRQANKPKIYACIRQNPAIVDNANMLQLKGELEKLGNVGVKPSEERSQYPTSKQRIISNLTLEIATTYTL